jgi:eukaryotic-like serine/threonine-protein kinase
MSVETPVAGRYRVERVLGGGAMAKVLLARDEELGRQVAVKLLDESLASDQSFRARFSREARLAAGLSHPNVVTVFDAGEADGRPYIVMEYVEGRTLDARLREQGPLPPEDVRRIGAQVCAGLEHAHANSLVHRDLKPGNLIERNDGTVKIADFGIARGDDATAITEAGTIIGTAAYLAPEQAESGPVTPRTDLYALGVVLYELLTGRRPWEVESIGDLARRRSEPLPTLPPEVPAGLREAVERSLAPNPEDRPASAAELGQLLLGRDDTATVVMRRPRARPSRPRRRAPVWTIGLLAVLVLGLGALGLALLGNDEPNPPAQAPSVEPIPDGATPSEDARNLADWLRENAGG